jgi:hypothetical protein
METDAAILRSLMNFYYGHGIPMALLQLLFLRLPFGTNHLVRLSRRWCLAGTGRNLMRRARREGDRASLKERNIHVELILEAESI